MKSRSKIAILTIAFLCALLMGYVIMPSSKHDDKVGSRIEDSDFYYEGGVAALPLHSTLVSQDKLQLGLLLFKDKRLSGDNTVSCNSCHDLEAYGAGNEAFSVGIGGQRGDANAPTVFNSSLNFRQFWNGRANSLTEQVDGPIGNLKEMASSWPELLTKIRNDPDYRARFQKVYGNEPNRATVTDALVQFESSLITLNAPFDRYLRGEKFAMTFEQKEGFKKFQSYGCVACHQGVNVGGNMFQTLGVMGDYFKDRGGFFPSDPGRFAITKNPEDQHVFRVPSLRNVAKTAPYFHDGQAQTLEQAVQLMGRYQLGRELSGQDIKELVSFLNALTGERPEVLSMGREVANEKAH